MSTPDRIPTEHEEQCEVVRWFRQKWPDVRIFSVPNGGHRHPAVAAKMKATGVVKGVPDLFVPAWRLWIEMKRIKGGSLSPEQKDWSRYLKSVGYWVIVGRGADDTKRQISAFFDQLTPPEGGLDERS